jgi:hypothetical protein
MDSLLKFAFWTGEEDVNFWSNSISQIGLLDLTSPIRSAFYSASEDDLGQEIRVPKSCAAARNRTPTLSPFP